LAELCPLDENNGIMQHNQAVDNEPSSDSGPSDGNNAQPAANRSELNVSSHGISEAFDAASDGTSTQDHPTRVAVPIMVHTDVKAPIPIHISHAAFEDDDKKLLASERTSGPEVDAIDSVAPIPPSSATQSTPPVNSATTDITESAPPPHAGDADDNSFDTTDDVSIHNQDYAGDAGDNSFDTTDDVTIHNQDWPVEDLADCSLPRATLITMEDELIFEAFQVDGQEPSLSWLKKKGHEIFLAILLVFLLSSSLAATFILLGARNECSSTESARLGVTLSSTVSTAPSTVPDTQSSWCNTYHLVYRGTLLDNPRTFAYPYVDIDGNNAVVGIFLSGELFYISNVMEEGQTQSSVTSLDLNSVLNIGISDGVAVAGVSSDSGYTALMVENHDIFWKTSSQNQTIEFHNNKDRPGLIDIDGDVIVVSNSYDIDSLQTSLVHIY
jgi:hypothetical protein